MLSICCNSRNKSWRNRKKYWWKTKIKPFIDKYNSQGISFPSKKQYWEKFEKNNVAIALYVLCAKKEKIHVIYKYIT